jgi:hypothetical protein
LTVSAELKDKLSFICVELTHMGKLRSVNNSVSSDSDRFLAVGSVTQSDQLVIELVQPPDTPAAILIKWPSKPTVTDPARLTATVAAIVRVLGAAQIELAARHAAGL